MEGVSLGPLLSGGLIHPHPTLNRRGLHSVAQGSFEDHSDNPGFAKSTPDSGIPGKS